jgi:hypothetical protein
VKRRFRALGPLSRFGAALRVLAAALTIVLLSAQGASALHELLVPHRVCAEHGHRVHGSALDHASAAPRTGAAPAALPGTADSEDHEHCALAARPEQTGLTLQRAPSSELARVADFARRSTERELLRAGPPLLLVAPKQSPPRA